MEAISEGQWDKYLSDEPDFMSQLLGNFSIPVHDHEVPTDNTNNKICSNLALPSASWPSIVHDSNLSFGDGTLMYYYYSSDDNVITSMHSSSHFFPTPSHHFLTANDHNFTGMVDYVVTVDANNDDAVQVDEFLNQDVSNDSFQGMSDLELGTRVEKTIVESERSKKRPRIPPDVQRSKKLKSCPIVDVEKNKTSININGTSCSEDYPDEISGPLHLTGKTRASKGTATDPQSLYARKRRERINERLRVLQNLVPNGTKVDISTMLEEAVQYVKFLQLQIKLLSSDDMWMYAPIAYNGMNLGFDLIISTPRSQS